MTQQSARLQLNKEREMEKGGERSEMKAWEQHSGVISMPRFDYNAPSSFLNHSLSGFLITSPIKREKSATKEAISILKKAFFVGNSDSGTTDNVESLEGNEVSKRRKISMEELNGKVVNNEENESTTDQSDESGKPLADTILSSGKTNSNMEENSGLSLVKLTRSGLLLFTFPTSNSIDTMGIVLDIFQCLDSGSLSSPLWCHRIFPIQATCSLNEEELYAVVAKLVVQFVNDKRNKIGRPAKFAVGYNRRGIEETEMKITKKTSTDSEPVPLLDRNKCFSTVAAAVKSVVSDSVVDLNSPQLCVLVELLPISGLPKGSLVVAVSVLPHTLVSTKPRLCVKALVSDTNATKNGKK